MHQLSSSFILGYHGCDRKIAERVLAGEPFVPSRNDYDWLGHGIYFWEANPQRGLDFIREVQERRRGSPNEIEDPTVVGAVIDLGYCLDLISTAGSKAVQATHQSFVELCKTANKSLPKNTRGDDLWHRGLDCAVINHLHALSKGAGKPFDTVRGVFIEGKQIYADSGFREKTHIQLSIVNPSCIKGVFRVPEAHLDPM